MMEQSGNTIIVASKKIGKPYRS
ncbi:uncharacterized protein METZ01_LOCUS359419, partial [marine metagenome]